MSGIYNSALPDYSNMETLGKAIAKALQLSMIEQKFVTDTTNASLFKFATKAVELIDQSTARDQFVLETSFMFRLEGHEGWRFGFGRFAPDQAAWKRFPVQAAFFITAGTIHILPCYEGKYEQGSEERATIIGHDNLTLEELLTPIIAIMTAFPR